MKQNQRKVVSKFSYKDYFSKAQNKQIQDIEAPSVIDLVRASGDYSSATAVDI